MVVRTIVHFEIPANDVERLAQFYRDCFGWRFEKAPMPGMDYWTISTGPRGKSVGGGMYKRMGADERPRNFVAVDHIDHAIEAFTTAGGSQVVGKMEVPGMGWSFIGSDPEGNVIALWQAQMAPRPRPRPRRAARKAPSRGAGRRRRR